MDDLYAVLGVTREADQAEIRAAFRRLARAYHPDRAPGSESRMVAINHAYAVLGDPERRRRYDVLHRAAPLPDRAPSDAAPPTEAPPWSETVPWKDDLAEHAEDWRQMYAEERHLWEQLLRAHTEAGPARAAVEAALAQAREAQLDLENALRARAGQAPISAQAFEDQRAQEASRRAGPGAAGCLLAFLPLRLGLAADAAAGTGARARARARR